MNKLILLMLITQVFWVTNAIALDVDYNDGLTHIIDYSNHPYNPSIPYPSDTTRLDHNKPYELSTHLEIVSGGLIGEVKAYQNSSVTMSAGRVLGNIDAFGNANITVTGGMAYRVLSQDNSNANISGGSMDSIIAYDNSIVTITGGSVEENIVAAYNASVTMTGGSVNEYLHSYGNSSFTISGGMVGGGFEAYDSSTITILGGSFEKVLSVHHDSIMYLDGTGFQVNGIPLSNGDRLSDFVPLYRFRPLDMNADHYRGIVTGTLADGTALDNTFCVWNNGISAGIAEIYIIPEPATLALLGLGSLVLRRRRA